MLINKWAANWSLDTSEQSNLVKSHQMKMMESKRNQVTRYQVLNMACFTALVS